MLYFFLIFNSNKNTSDLIPQLIHTPATNEVIISQLLQVFRYLLTDVCFLYYQLSCHNCFHLAITLKSVAAKLLVQPWKQRIIALLQIKALCGMLQGSLATKLYAT